MSKSSFHLHFITTGQAYDFDFKESTKATSDTIPINGRNYELLGDSSKIAWLKAKLPELDQSKDYSTEVLCDRLFQVGAEDISITKTTESVGLNQLGIETTKIKTKQQQLGTAIDQASKLLYGADSATQRAAIVKALEEEINQQKIKEAYGVPIPWIWAPNETPVDGLDVLDKPPVLKGMTMREVMLLGTIATILGKNEQLEQLVLSDYKKDWQAHTGVKFVRVDDGRELSYKTFGNRKEGTPCIVLQSGLGNNLDIWSDVEDVLIKNPDAYGLSYNRTGYGGSDPSKNPHSGSIEEVVKDMDSMLIKLEELGKITPPYILVGHSFGGMCMQYYAILHPDKVSGLVLVDSSDDQSVTPTPPPSLQIRNYPLGLMPQSTAEVLFHDMPFLLSMKSEIDHIQSSMKTLHDKVGRNGASQPIFGTMPLRVLTSTAPIGDTDEKITMRDAHLNYQKAFLERSSDAKQVLTSCGHFVQKEDPTLVSHTILGLLSRKI